MPVAETFTFTDEKGTSLNDVARLDTLSQWWTVRPSSTSFTLPASCGAAVGKSPRRTSAPWQLFCDQLEFANVIVMNKMDLMDDDGRARLHAIVRRFNLAPSSSRRRWVASNQRGCSAPASLTLPRRSSTQTGSGARRRTHS